LLVSWCAGGRCGMTCNDKIMAGVGDLLQRTANGRTGWVLGGRRSRGRVALCAVYTVHVETRSVGFLIEHEN
jgi:hypothetical protein